MRIKMPFSSRGVAKVENRGKIIFKWAQPQEGALKMGAEYPKRGAKQGKKRRKWVFSSIPF